MTTLQIWHDFFMFAGGAAATLLGLVFVAASIAATIPNEKLGADATRHLWVRPIVWAFLRVLVVSAVGLVPEMTGASFGYVVVGLGLFDLGRMAQTIAGLNEVHRTQERLSWGDWGWYAAYPVLATLLIVAAGMALARQWPFPPHVLAAGLIGHLVVGVRTAWELADWLAMRQ
jgi:hypothetical protein